MQTNLSTRKFRGQNDPITRMARPRFFEKQMSFVYLLRNLRGRFCLGWGTDIKRRLGEHNSGKNSYTKSKGPWESIGYEEFSNIEEAKKREHVLKNNPRMLKFFKKRALATLRVSATSQQNMQVMG